MNNGRIVLGGLLAGVVMNVVDAIGNGFILGAQWAAETNAISPTLKAKMDQMSMVGWIAFDFVVGILLVWLYAAIRPRFGAGPRTALLAGFMIWLITHVCFYSFWFMGLYSLALVTESTLVGLVAGLLGGLAGGAVYKEA